MLRVAFCIALASCCPAFLLFLGEMLGVPLLFNVLSNRDVWPQVIDAAKHSNLVLHDVAASASQLTTRPRYGNKKLVRSLRRTAHHSTLVIFCFAPRSWLCLHCSRGPTSFGSTLLRCRP